MVFSELVMLRVSSVGGLGVRFMGRVFAQVQRLSAP